MKHLLILITIAVLCASCSVLCNKKLHLKKTAWSCVEEEFVADAGTMTITTTLKFVSAKEFVLETLMEMPAYPSMYMNPDGSHDYNPATSSTWTKQGTYSVKGNVITLTSDEDKTYTLHYVSGKLETADLSYRPLTLTKQRKH